MKETLASYKLYWGKAQVFVVEMCELPCGSGWKAQRAEGGEPRNAAALGRELSFSPEFNRTLNMDVCNQDGLAEFIHLFVYLSIWFLSTENGTQDLGYDISHFTFKIFF